MDIRNVQMKVIVVGEPPINFLDVIGTILCVQQQVVQRCAPPLMQVRVQ